MVLSRVSTICRQTLFNLYQFSMFSFVVVTVIVFFLFIIFLCITCSSNFYYSIITHSIHIYLSLSLFVVFFFFIFFEILTEMFGAVLLFVFGTKKQNNKHTNLSKTFRCISDYKWKVHNILSCYAGIYRYIFHNFFRFVFFIHSNALFPL